MWSRSKATLDEKILGFQSTSTRDGTLEFNSARVQFKNKIYPFESQARVKMVDNSRKQKLTNEMTNAWSNTKRKNANFSF